MTRFGENLARLRRRSGLTQEQLAEALDVSRQAVGKWEAGTAHPAAEKLPLLADLLHCSLDALLRDGVKTAEEEADAQEETAEAAEEADTVGEIAPEDPPVQPQEAPQETEAAADDTAARTVKAAAFAEYDAHKNRFSVQIAAGVGLILTGVAALLFLLERSAGLSICALLLAVAAAVVLFIVAGVAERAFWVEYPLVPNWYTAEEKQRFQKVFGIGIACSVALVLVAVAVLVLLGFGGPGGTAADIGIATATTTATEGGIPADDETEEAMGNAIITPDYDLSVIESVVVTGDGVAAGKGPDGLRATGTFMLILAGAVAALVYLGIQYSKYQFRNESGWITRKGAAARCKAAVKRRKERRNGDGADL